MAASRSALSAVRELVVPYNGDGLRVEIASPPDAIGVVLLARDNGNIIHGRSLAFALRSAGMGTAVGELLTGAERARALAARRRALNVPLMTCRLGLLVDALRVEPEIANKHLAIVASGTFGAAALRFVSVRPFDVDALVCRGAMLDRVEGLSSVQAATMLLVVAGDLDRLHSNQRVFRHLDCPKRFEVLPGTSPHFADECSFDLAAHLTVQWLAAQLHTRELRDVRSRSDDRLVL